MTSWSEVPVTVKKWTAAFLGLVAVVAVFFTLHPYFPPSIEASPASIDADSEEASDRQRADLKESSDREQADIELQLGLLELDIRYYLDKQEKEGQLSPGDTDKLDLLKSKRDRLTTRLKSILA